MRLEVLHGMTPFEILVAPTGTEVALPAPFGRVLPRLALPEPRSDVGPRLLVNFVTTLNGAVRLSTAVPDSRDVSLRSDHDWLLLGVLRTLAPAILIGAEPLRTGRSRQDGAAALGALAPEVRAMRRSFALGALHHVIVTGSGTLPPDNPVWHGPATVITTTTGARALRGSGLPASVEVIVDPAATNGRVSAGLAVQVGRQRAASAAAASGATLPPFLLGEPGPGLFSEILGAGLVDELFLTESPVLAGPAPGRLDVVSRPAYAELTLSGLSRAGSHLFGRWRPQRAGRSADEVVGQITSAATAPP